MIKTAYYLYRNIYIKNFLESYSMFMDIQSFSLHLSRAFLYI